MLTHHYAVDFSLQVEDLQLRHTVLETVMVHRANNHSIPTEAAAKSPNVCDLS